MTGPRAFDLPLLRARVPACLNNLYGVKPSRGLLSASGMLPACRSLDCMTIFALTADQSNTVLSIAEGVDCDDGYSRENPFIIKLDNMESARGRCASA